MKGKMVLENKIAKILKRFGVKVAMYNQFLYSENWVFFTPFESFALGEYHREWIAEHFGVKMNVGAYFLFSLLHEVGHHFTLKELTAEDMEYETFCRQILKCSEDSAQEVNEAYFNLPAEILATRWALEFMLNNEEWCIKSTRKIIEALRHFRNVNGWGL